MPGTLFVVATPIGNLEDITLRALRVLREVKLIAAEDTRRTARLLARHAIATPTTSFHAHNEHRKTPWLLAKLGEGQDIALVSDAGTPIISDPGSSLVRAAMDAGVTVVPIPGPSAVLAALAVSGFAGNEFRFLGFPPIRSKDRSTWFERLTEAPGTVIFFEAPHRIRHTLQELAIFIGDRPIIVARELTKAHETVVKRPISNILAELLEPRGEFTVVFDVGRKTESVDVRAELVERSRRQALSNVAREHGLTANQLYRAIEDAKKSVERQT
jgi:16S rRNA (cytidine1402-2'-O)-methyltransferase